ncbi:hypothetical protein K437DRAFT_254453 [Tilletiaria anomala UBC 951]|uniref:Conserved oligomeric Golgi complex subunit 5 n=1 Tax=Tilletiaria anomala (strain ATCC 24038 / CBS 436.72 / UBC 951) TaxID=1037660 RepID=A0A066WES9_TILAU|nr:uncharacterized protein K437DRAFT_254453 [Tilletiaria anomala UBC 951]KDN52266.1 hypothetical protein K437DRAFT_254453 [Tilletiaria anomala UBC 951]
MGGTQEDVNEVFLRPDFSAQAYANAIIEGRSADGASQGQSQGQAQSSVTLALSKLNIALDDSARLIKEEVTASATELVASAQHACQTEGELSVLCSAIAGLQQSTREMKQKVTSDYHLLGRLQTRTEKLQQVAGVIRNTVRFVVLCRRLDTQLRSAVPCYSEAQASRDCDGPGEEGGKMAALAETPEDGNAAAHLVESASQLPKAAVILTAIEGLLVPAQDSTSAELSITGLHVVQQRQAWVIEARQFITERMEDIVVQGLKELSIPLLSASLATALNLGGLPELVQDLLADLTDVVRERTRAAFDVATLAREAAAASGKAAAVGRSYAPRSTAGAAGTRAEQDARYAALLWRRMQTLLVHEMSAVCKKVYTLEKVLRLKTSTSPADTSGVDQQDEHGEARGAGADNGKTLLEDAMAVLEDKPSLLFWRTLAESFERESGAAMQASAPFKNNLEQGFLQLLQIFLDFFDQITLYTDTVYTFERQTPESLMLMTKLSALSRGYVARVASRLDDAASTSFSSRNVPGQMEGAHFAKLLCKELEQVKDPLLLPALVRCAENAAQDYFDQLLRLRVSPPLNLAAGQSFSGHLRNADLASAAYAIVTTLLERKHSSSPALRSFLQSNFSKFEQAVQEQFFTPLFESVQTQLQLPISRMQYTTETKHFKSVSPYMADLSDRMALLRDSILPKYQIGDVKEDWLKRIVEATLNFFVEQLEQLSSPDVLTGNSRLTADISELQLSASKILANGSFRESIQLDALPAHSRLQSLRNMCA